MEITHKIRTFFKTVASKKAKHGGEKNVRVKINYNEKKCLPVITYNKKHSSKQVLRITNTVEKSVFTAGTFKGLWFVSLDCLSLLWFVWKLVDLVFSFLQEKMCAPENSGTSQKFCASQRAR